MWVAHLYLCVIDVQRKQSLVLSGISHVSSKDDFKYANT